MGRAKFTHFTLGMGRVIPATQRITQLIKSGYGLQLHQRTKLKQFAWCVASASYELPPLTTTASCRRRHHRRSLPSVADAGCRAVGCSCYFSTTMSPWLHALLRFAWLRVLHASIDEHETSNNESAADSNIHWVICTRWVIPSLFGYGQYNVNWVWGKSGVSLGTPIPSPTAGLLRATLEL
jgi:hypothetical protein